MKTVHRKHEWDALRIRRLSAEGRRTLRGELAHQERSPDALTRLAARQVLDLLRQAEEINAPQRAVAAKAFLYGDGEDRAAARRVAEARAFLRR